jgi:tetratricopeptide (TPR) repeat protein
VAWTARAALAGSRRSTLRVAAALAGVVLAVLAALTHRQLGFWRDHETLFLRTLAVTGPNAAAHASLAGVYGDRGNVAGALQHAAEAVRIDPNNVLGLTNLSIALRQSGRREEALEVATRATRAGDRDPDAWLALARAARELGMLQEARDGLARAIALDQTDPRAWTELASVELSTNAPAAAVEALRSLTRISPEDPRAWFNLGYALGAAARPREAVEAYARALELRPTYATAFQNLSVTCATLGSDAPPRCARVAGGPGLRP